MENVRQSLRRATRGIEKIDVRQLDNFRRLFILLTISKKYFWDGITTFRPMLRSPDIISSEKTELTSFSFSRSKHARLQNAGGPGQI
jgi:hypothetical protein